MKRIGISSVAVIASVALGVVGCQSNDDAPVPETPADASDTAHPGAGPVTADSTPRAAPVAESPDLFSVPAGGVYFFTPSRNIACGMASSLIGCQVFRTQVLPPGAQCDGATMPVAQLSKGYLSQDGGRFTPSCFNQGVFNMAEDQRTLPYGHSLTAGGTTCVSEINGVTCRRDGHGFFVSVQDFRQW